MALTRASLLKLDATLRLSSLSGFLPHREAYAKSASRGNAILAKRGGQRDWTRRDSKRTNSTEKSGRSWGSLTWQVYHDIGRRCWLGGRGFLYLVEALGITMYLGSRQCRIREARGDSMHSTATYDDEVSSVTPLLLMLASPTLVELQATNKSDSNLDFDRFCN
jgi:hypothetical protein